MERSNLISEAINDVTALNSDIGLRLKCTNLLLEILLLFPEFVSDPNNERLLGLSSMPLQDAFRYILEQGLNENDKVFRVNIFVFGM